MPIIISSAIRCFHNDMKNSRLINISINHPDGIERINSYLIYQIVEYHEITFYTFYNSLV